MSSWQIIIYMLPGKEQVYVEGDGKANGESDDQGQYWIKVLACEHRRKKTYSLLAHAKDLKCTRIECEDPY